MFPIHGDNQALEIFRKTPIKSPNIISLLISLTTIAITMELSLCQSTAAEAMKKHLHGFYNPRNSWTTSLINEEHDAMDQGILGLEGPLICC